MTSEIDSNARRHDLDALRAIAMLLGIVLHGAISFYPEPIWPVHDNYQYEWLRDFVAGIHGFRMPLFFLISGFFTAMLWRKRGLKPLIVHRCKRILLPLGVGLVTIIPITWLAMTTIPSVYNAIANDLTAEADDNSIPPDADLWGAIYTDNVGLVQRELENGIDANCVHQTLKVNALSYAAMVGAEDSAKLLLENGADSNLPSPNDSGSSPLHCAAFMGRSEIVSILLEHDADTEQRGRDGLRAIDTTNADIWLTRTIAQYFNIRFTAEELHAGRREVRRLLGGSVDDIQADDKEAGSMPEILALFIYLPVFHHLWFLWYLCWLVAFFAFYVKAAETMRLRRLPRWLVMPPVSLIWLIPATMLIQSLMKESFGPGTAIGILPHPVILAYYCVFFFFGAWYFDCDDRECAAGKYWWLALPVALLVALPLGLEFLRGQSDFATQYIAQEYQTTISFLCQAVYVWLMSFGLFGLFHRFCSGGSPRIRYISDSSYWLYLAHLPLIVVLQTIVQDIPLPGLIKLVLICAICTAFLLLTYRFAIRYTIIGTCLNGRRTKPVPDIVLPE